jgi:hypothetical protein
MASHTASLEVEHKFLALKEVALVQDWSQIPMAPEAVVGDRLHRGDDTGMTSLD